MDKLRTCKWLILALLVASLAGRMLLTTKHFYTHDDLQVYRVNEFLSCIKRGEIPCRWAATLGKGYGYPWFNYYPPMIYVIPAAIHSLGVPLTGSLNLLMFGSFILAAWGMYLLVQVITSRDDLAFLGSILYTLYPFHATNVFLRGVYAENLAWSLAPLILYLMTRQSKTGQFSRLLPFVFATVFLTHVISSFLILGMCLVWQLILNYRSWRWLLTQLLLGLSFAAFFLVPALVEKNLVQADTLTAGYYSYLNHYVSFKQLFLEYRWNYGASYWGTPPEEMGYMVGHLHLILLSLGVILASIWGRKKPLYLTATLLLLIFMLTLFITHSRSAPIYSLIPQLAYIQFPWRFVGWAGLPLSLAIVSYLSTFTSKGTKPIFLIIVSLALIIYSYPFFAPREYDNLTDRDFLTGSEKYAQQDKALFDYLPKTVKELPSVYRDFSTTQVNTFYFPGWTAQRLGQPVSIIPDPHTGLIQPEDKETDNLELVWRETPFRLSMDLISLLSLAGYLMYNIAYGKIRQA